MRLKFILSKGLCIMGLFNKILGKLGIGKKEEAPQTASAALGAKPAAAAPAKPAAAPVKPAPTAAPAPKPATPAPAPVAKPAPQEENIKERVAPKPAAISEVDVVAKLEEMGKGKGLNWKVSIVDLLKLLDLDSSFDARKELATELGCPAELMGDSAKMNTWLHKEVLKQIAANGGNIPKELLD
jgi:pyruvate/2-oxoglutarate dehydrogenase complex dihydrolipoamide acyltransferase (E2) component